jgi:hypothetical protein
MTRPPRSGRMIHHRAPPCLASAASAAAFSGGVRPLRQKHLPDPIAVTELVDLNDQHLGNANAADSFTR